MLLTQTELAQVVATKLVTVSPTSESSTYVLQPGSTVGTVVFKDVRLLIRPKISLENVFFLLGFRPDLIKWGQESFPYERAPDLLNVMARLFDTAVERAIPRGIARGYLAREESLTTVRGRIDITAQVARRGGAHLPLECRYEELTEDIVLNRMLKAATRRLLFLPGIEASVRKSLAFRRRSFADVSDLEFHPGGVPTLAFSRLNDHWEIATRLAELILRQSAVRDDEGTVIGTSFLVDMNKAFEKFLEEVFKTEMRAHGWDLAPQQTRELTDEISLSPDFIVQRFGRDLVVADAKYRRADADVQDNVYQMLAYCIALQLPRGVLIYATEREPQIHVVKGNGVKIELVGVDLGASHATILRRTKELAHQLMRYAREESTGPIGVAS